MFLDKVQINKFSRFGNIQSNLSASCLLHSDSEISNFTEGRYNSLYVIYVLQRLHIISIYITGDVLQVYIVQVHIHIYYRCIYATPVYIYIYYLLVYMYICCSYLYITGIYVSVTVSKQANYVHLKEVRQQRHVWSL